jgi:hypothetical protein
VHVQDAPSGEVILRKGQSALFASKSFEFEVYHHTTLKTSGREQSSVMSKDFPFDSAIATLPQTAKQQLQESQQMPLL